MALDVLKFHALSLASPNKDVVLVLGTNIIEPGKIGQFVLCRRNLRHMIHDTREFIGPYMLQLALGRHIHTHRVCLQEVESHQRTVLIIHRIINGLHIADRLCHTDLSIEEMSLHLLGSDLVIVNAVGQHLYRQGLSYDMNQTQG